MKYLAVILVTVCVTLLFSSHKHNQTKQASPESYVQLAPQQPVENPKKLNSQDVRLIIDAYDKDQDRKLQAFQEAVKALSKVQDKSIDQYEIDEKANQEPDAFSKKMLADAQKLMEDNRKMVKSATSNYSTNP